MKKVIIIGHCNIGKTLLNIEGIKCDFTHCSTTFMDKPTKAFKDLSNSCKKVKKATDLVVNSIEKFKLNKKLYKIKNIGSKYHK
jgi:hypothetical protein